MSIHRPLFSLLCLLGANCLSFTVFGQNAPRGVDRIVAVVNSEPITAIELNARQSRLVDDLRLKRQPVPDSQKLYAQVLDQMIEERAILHLAKDAGVRTSDTQLTEALEGIARQNGLSTPAELRKKYEASGGNWALYTQDLRDELTLQQIRERELNARVRISDPEVEAALRESAQKVSQLQIAHILVAVPDNASEQEVQTRLTAARQLRARAMGGEDFTKLAKDNSQAADRERGGDLGLRPLELIAPVFLSAVQTLREGQIAEVARSGAGFHVVKLVRREHQTRMTLPQTRARHILIAPGPNISREQALVRMGELKTRIERQQESFADAARAYSSDGSATRGGDLGWANPGMLVPEFENAMNALKIGEVSAPVVSQFGVHLIEVLERRDYALTDSEQRDVIRAQLRAKKSQEVLTLWVNEVRNRAFVEIRENYN